ncbi:MULTISPECIES: D-arabinono-1,4-lactone oxidase [Acinetobacter]|jgi:FAD-linked oxidoreductase|uniref:D-arabinono-1,4-lactone oxidase n=1 Tax=Acinetobacter TaxID=469 RepID=UPI000EA29DC9|nr:MULTISPECIES: D-arabinono-1,4-lactone oxidase [Acinetobacter]RKG44568.1 FAD-binding protein [Acinetobacter cumulans]RZG59819.1 FAD-binding protein [Acinetobacter sp. WCHAc060006]
MINMQSEFWSNWSGSQQAYPKVLRPNSLEVLQNVIRTHPKIRVIGAGHSFSGLAQTNDVLLSLDYFKGVVSHDDQHCQSVVQAGTHLYDLGEKLAAYNQALMNQGDIDQKTLAGAIATGTHGTGIDLQCLSAYVEGFELITADGDLIWCDTLHHREIYQAGRVAFGSLGLMTKIKLQNRPMYKLKEQIRSCPFTEVLQHIEQWKSQHRHIEFWAFIHSPNVILKTLDETNEPVQPKTEQILDEDVFLRICSELTKSCPVLNPALQKLVSLLVRPSTAIDWSSRIFPAVRETRFNEMEYQLPVKEGLACLEELMYCLKKHKVPMFFPIEFRYVKADDIWLSPFYQQDSISISIHQYYRQDYVSIFKLAEPIFQKYGGRPHWGKLHTLGGDVLSTLYPKWDDFMHLRQQLDPEKKWINSHLEHLFWGRSD